MIKIKDGIKILKKIDNKYKILYKNRFFYDDTKMSYFDVKDFSFKNFDIIKRHLCFTNKEIESARKAGIIPTYEGVCYLDGGKKGYYNLLDKTKIAQEGKIPVFHPLLKRLIHNLCNNKKENIDWLLEAIIYKYTHLNNVLIPAVVFHGVGSAGKGLFLDLLSQIFGKTNVLQGLPQKEISSRFSRYTGRKLVVGFNELIVNNTAASKRDMANLKNLIMEKKINIEKKGQDGFTVDNLAWFILTSNDVKPLHLDSTNSGNRRFSIITTGGKINNKEGLEIVNIIKNKEHIENFISWLLKEFPNIKEKKYIHPLDNDDKKDLELASESAGNLFFKWIEEIFPHVNKILVPHRMILLDIYKKMIGDDDDYDKRYKPNFFNRNLSARYKLTRFRLDNGERPRGYKIDKTVEGDGLLTEEEVDNLKNNPNR